MHNYHPNRLAFLRVAAGLTQRELADRAGVTRLTISNIERGNHQARIATRHKLLRVLGIPIERNVEVFGPWPTWTRAPKNT